MPRPVDPALAFDSTAAARRRTEPRTPPSSTLMRADRRAASDRPRNTASASTCGWYDSSHDLQSGLLIWEGILVVDNQPYPPG